MQFTVGNKVRIRRDLGSRNKYPADGVEISVNGSMLHYAGQTVTICDIVTGRARGKIIMVYRIKEDGKTWSWVDSMFEGAVLQMACYNLL